MERNFVITLDGRASVSMRLLRLAEQLVRIALAAALLSLANLHRQIWIAGTAAVLLAVVLLIGWQLRRVALLNAIAFVLYAVANFFLAGPAAPLTYVALAAASAAFLLFATSPVKTKETTK